MRYYSPFTDERTEFQLHHLSKVSSQTNYAGVSVQLSLRPPLISAVADGDLGPMTGAGVRGPSLSSFCPWSLLELHLGVRVY